MKEYRFGREPTLIEFQSNVIENYTLTGTIIKYLGETMEITTLLEYSDRSQLRAWLQENHSKEKECWVVMSRSKTPPPGILPYIDVVEEALCFGWIDSTLKKLPDGRLAQRLSPRRKNSHWTKLNMDRCLDLEDRGLMTPAGKRTLNFVNKR